MYKNNASWFKNRCKSTIKKRNMQENVRFFDMKLHKNAYFSVCKVHKIARISHFNRSKGLSKNSQTNIKKSAHGEGKKSTKSLKSLTKKSDIAT